MWYLKMLSALSGVIKGAFLKEGEGSDVSSHFQQGLYRACGVPSETSPEPSGEEKKLMDQTQALRHV